MRRQKDLLIETWTLIGAVLDAMTLRKTLTIFFLNAPALQVYALSDYLSLLSYFPSISVYQHELPYLEEEKRGLYGTTYLNLSMDLIILLEGM